MSEVEYIVVHCSATPPSMDIGAKQIDEWHKAKGWLMIGYHRVIRRGGMVEDGRPLDADHILEPNEVGAHVEGFNSRSIGICMIGGVEEEDRVTPQANFTEAQYAVLKQQLSALHEQFPAAKVVGHCDLNPHKACPSFNVAHWLEQEGMNLSPVSPKRRGLLARVTGATEE